MLLAPPSDELPARFALASFACAVFSWVIFVFIIALAVVTKGQGSSAQSSMLIGLLGILGFLLSFAALCLGIASSLQQTGRRKLGFLGLGLGSIPVLLFVAIMVVRPGQNRVVHSSPNDSGIAASVPSSSSPAPNKRAFQFRRQFSDLRMADAALTIVPALFMLILGFKALRNESNKSMLWGRTMIIIASLLILGTLLRLIFAPVPA